MLQFIDDTKKEYFALPFEEMSNPTGVNGIDKYKHKTKGIPIHVRGSIVYNQFISESKLTNKYQMIYDKTKVKVSYIKEPNRFGSHVIAIPNNSFPTELIDAIQLDYETMFEKNFVKPLERFMNILKWDMERQHKWDDLF
jgi:hypothetical protein